MNQWSPNQITSNSDRDSPKSCRISLSPYGFHPCHSDTLRSDSGLCEDMNNCRLTETWTSYMYHHSDLPMTQVPILNQYCPPSQFPNRLKKNFEMCPQHLLVRHEQPSHSILSQPKAPLSSMEPCESRARTSIKFQDRNRKLDFKVNFRDENRKVDGCFHREENRKASEDREGLLPHQPKKKWIRHYMTGNVILVQ